MWQDILVLLLFDSLIDTFTDLSNNLVSNPLLIGVIIFLFFTMFALFLLIPFGGLVVIEVPVLFAVFEFIPALRIVVGILLGLLIGLGLLKWIRR
jgi:hypothetical protein